MVEKAKKQGSFVSPPVPTISESSGIPKRKYFSRRLENRASPAVHRAGIFCVFIAAEGLLAGDSGGARGEISALVFTLGGIAGAAILTTKDGALRMRRPSSLTDDRMRLRAGVPVAVAAEIRSRLGIVGTEPLNAISRI